MTQAEGRTLWREYTTELDTTVVPNATIDLYMDRGQEALNDIISYFWKDDTVALVADTQEYSLPADCLEVLWAAHNSLFLKEFSQSEYRREYTNWRSQAAGTPTDYAIYGRKIIVNPKPNAAAVSADSTLDLRFLATPTGYASTAFDQLASQHHSIVVLWGASLWLKAHGFDSTFARAKALEEEAIRRAQGAAHQYNVRAIQGKGKA